MNPTYRIHPSIGISRLGNSPDEFYIEPVSTGGLPIEADEFGNEILEGGQPKLVGVFKDSQGRVKRQASKFRIFRVEGHGEVELTLNSEDVASMSWRVHLANKKATWYNFSMLQGNTMYSRSGFDNSYAAQKVPLRNSKQISNRQSLIIDPGPREINGANLSVEIGDKNIPSTYTHGSFPGPKKYGYDIDKLGDLKTDSEGRLLVLGGLGLAGGDEPISSFAGADTWNDDIADGTVDCTVRFHDGSEVTLQAWVIVGSPKFAPQIDNICTLSDTMLDVAIRYARVLPEMYNAERWPESDGWNPGYVVNYDRDVAPIINRPKKYQWVANVQPMMAFAMINIDFSDSSPGNASAREAYFRYFRKPGLYSGDHQVLFGSDNVPMLPLNSGSNSVNNVLIEKFLALTETQYYFMQQWADGKFEVKDDPNYPGISAADQIPVSNCVGLPMCPGIEVTWNTQNAGIYIAPYQIKRRHDGSYYDQNGLSPDEDETDGAGCEPGDLTKRMAIPWQADFFDCTVQYINFTDPNVNKANGIPVPPTYYSYWWPPQSPWDVISGVMTPEEQQAANVPAGLQVNFARGINDFSQMIHAWSYMGFILNQNTGENAELFPFFTERERNHDMFVATSIPVSQVSGNKDDVLEIPIFYLKDHSAEEQPTAKPAVMLKTTFANNTDKDVNPLVVQQTDDVPRSGSRIRF